MFYMREVCMTLLEQIQYRLTQLPPERQQEVLDFVTFLQNYGLSPRQVERTRSLRNHNAFGSWKKRNIDALSYEQTLRAEWDIPS
jgi:hypothetical protein